ncbi:MAG TPA: MMPL family transporter [Candidatus Agrococcus pullicola]|uniref:MMPL family transporter n=1 Tax=Candidatus Agrococcus pullicola TaxID=2838429 RepID=A0A9D1YX16_9MICO|nr:MMPL family transporter [Candidatus Agrococcus pullicola]
MKDFSVLRAISERLVSRRGAWIALGISLVLFVALFGLLRQADAPGNGPAAPDNSESARAAELLQEFPDADEQSLLLVANRDDGAAITASDAEALGSMATTLEQEAEGDASGPILSDDERAAIVVFAIEAGTDNVGNADALGELRSTVTSIAPAGMTVLVTGGPAFGADIAAAFDGADFTLLLVTIVIVAVLLILTYRSPVLWLVPLAVVGVAEQVANKATAALGDGLGLFFDAGIISVLVFGAGTNYALLFISRYREELRIRDDHREALATAWRHTLPAIVASNVTVVAALLTLALAVIPGTRGLGLSAALGLLIALVAVVFVLPPSLAVCGRRVFWPFIPKPGAEPKRGSVWRAVATRVNRKPVVALSAGIAVLAIMATGLLGTTVGLTQLEKFRVPSDSAAGLEVLSDHFDAGEAQPITIVANNDATDAVLESIEGVDGIVRAHPAGTSTDGELVSIMVTGAFAPGTPESLDLVRELRDLVHEVPEADALVGGAIATDVDARDGNERDLLLVAPLVLAVSFIVLLLLLRSLIAPVLLLLVNLASSVAAIGAGAWLSGVAFGQPALDLQVPLLAFLFLVALGIDYTIFLVHRARTETAALGTRMGMVESVTKTGAVITSAGIVLAGVFAALGVLPLVTLGQLGLIVGVGVIVDTLLVRTVIVPALFGLIGERIWWPGNPEKPRDRKRARELVHEDHAG